MTIQITIYRREKGWFLPLVTVPGFCRCGGGCMGEVIREVIRIAPTSDLVYEGLLELPLWGCLGVKKDLLRK
jgi:hypothetical protein